MRKYIPILQKTSLFAQIGEEEILSMLICLNPRICSYKKGEYVFRQGERLNQIAVLVEGGLHIQREDYWGNRSIINAVDAGELFGEAYVSPDSGAFPNDVVAAENSEVMFFDIHKIFTACSSACHFHSMIIQNLFFAIADKNRKLIRKLGHISQRTTREKLMSYLSEEAARQKSGTFTIPFNRQQLADFLSVERSAMSHELCKMRDEGLIIFKKNKFRLL